MSLGPLCAREGVREAGLNNAALLTGGGSAWHPLGTASNITSQLQLFPEGSGSLGEGTDIAVPPPPVVRGDLGKEVIPWLSKFIVIVP